MKRALLLYFLVSLVIGTFIYGAQSFKLHLPNFINNYVNDFLIIPIVLTPCLYLLRWSKGNKTYMLPLWIILFLCAFYSVLFEVYLPRIFERYTADIVDVFLYFTSGIVFFFLQKERK